MLFVIPQRICKEHKYLSLKLIFCFNIHGINNSSHYLYLLHDSEMRTLVLSIIFFVIGILFLLIANFPSFPAAFILKTLMIPVLAVIFIVNLKPGDNFLHKLMIAGLFFSWAGDVLLEIHSERADLFIPGLISFLLAHVMYLTTFFMTRGENFINKRGIWLLLPVLLFGTGIIFYLHNDLGDMMIPVIIYTFVILAMLTGAINRLKKVNALSYWLVLTGAILFLISDSALAINKFGHPFTGSSIVVMSTYLFAQYLIITGYIRQFRSELK